MFCLLSYFQCLSMHLRHSETRMRIHVISVYRDWWSIKSVLNPLNWTWHTHKYDLAKCFCSLKSAESVSVFFSFFKSIYVLLSSRHQMVWAPPRTGCGPSWRWLLGLFLWLLPSTCQTWRDALVHQISTSQALISSLTFSCVYLLVVNFVRYTCGYHNIKHIYTNTLYIQCVFYLLNKENKCLWLLMSAKNHASKSNGLWDKKYITLSVDFIKYRISFQSVSFLPSLNELNDLRGKSGECDQRHRAWCHVWMRARTHYK